MKRAFHVGLVAVVAAGTLALAQGSEVARVLGAARDALGGDAALSAVRTLAFEGTRTRSTGEGASRASEFEMAFALPDRFVRKDVMANINGMQIMRSSGFNGAEPIEKVDTPPQMGGHMVFRSAGGASSGGSELTPEERETARANALRASRHDFARLTLGMFAASLPAFPVEFTYVGVAESPDGLAEVLDVAGADGFTVRLFVDQKTHLPLMLSWMDKEPLTMVAGAGPGVVTMERGGPGGVPMGRAGSPEELEKMQAEMTRRLEEAEAKRRVVEYRMFYGGYKAFDDVKLPTRIQWMVDGQPTEELELERVRVNVNIDPKAFEISRHDER